MWNWSLPLHLFSDHIPEFAQDLRIDEQNSPCPGQKSDNCTVTGLNK